MKYFQHETAIVDRGADIGEGVKIWHWCHVCATAKIGEVTSIGQNVYIGNDVIIGRGVKIQNNVSVYDGVIIDDNVFVGPSAVFTNVINPRAEIIRKTEIKKTYVSKGATLGANCTILCGVSIGKYAFIGAGAVVTKSTKDYALLTGVPAKQTGWMSAYGEKIPLPLEGNSEWICNKTGQVYRLSGKKMRGTGIRT